MKNLLTYNKFIQMKKVLFSLVAMGFLATTLISCQSNQKGTAESGGDTTTKKATSKVPTPTVTPPTIAKTGNENLDVLPNEKVEVPQFSSEDVNTVFAKYEPLRQEYSDALTSNDVGKIKELTAKHNALVKETLSYAKKLPASENQLYIDTYTKFITQWDKLSLKQKK